MLLLSQLSSFTYTSITKPTTLIKTTMATQLLLTLFLLSFTVATIQAEDTGYVGTVDPKSLGLNKKKTLSHFRLYWQDVISGSNATAINIIPAIPKYNTTTSFGSVTVTDNALTVGPELSSKVVGRSEGIYALTSQSQVTLLMVMNFVLTEGKYNGSSLTIVGRNVAYDEQKELPVVGGSGVFKFATGYAHAKTYHFDPTTGDATTEYNIYVFHYWMFNALLCLLRVFFYFLFLLDFSRLWWFSSWYLLIWLVLAIAIRTIMRIMSYFSFHGVVFFFFFLMSNCG